MNVYRVVSDTSITKQRLLDLLESCKSVRELAQNLFSEESFNEKIRQRLNSVMSFYNLEDHYEVFKEKFKVEKKIYYKVDAVLVKDSSVSQNYLKTFLIKNKILDHTTCVLCKLKDTHNGEKLVFQLDHIDGNRTNNELSNLRYLCPNCHTQTETYCRGQRPLGQTRKLCDTCKVNTTKVDRGNCKECHNKLQGINKIKLLSKEDLQLLVDNYAMMEMCAILRIGFENLSLYLEEIGLKQKTQGEWMIIRAEKPVDFELFKEVLEKYNLEGRFDWKRTPRKPSTKEKVVKPRKPKAQRVSCLRGHEFTPENTVEYPDPKGGNPKRICLACEKLRYARRRKREGKAPPRERD